MKKLLATLLASAMALATVGGLVACGGGDDEEKVTPVKATGIVLTNAYGKELDKISIAPDGTVGVLAKLTPANANSNVTWTLSGATDDVLVMKEGGLYNTQAFFSCFDQKSGQTITLTVKVDDQKVTVPVNVLGWPKYYIAGDMSTVTSEDWKTTPDAWAADKLFETENDDLMFDQDPTDKHLWTKEINIHNAGYGFKIGVAQMQEDGTYKGQGWGASFGVDKNEDGSVEETDTDKLTITGEKGNFILQNDGANIILGDDGVEGKYRITIVTKPGGSVKTISYELIEADE